MTGWFMWSITFSISLAALARIMWLTVLDEKNFGLKMQNVPCSERETPPDRLLCSLADKGFRRHGNIGHFQKRSLANYWDECIWNVMLKARCHRLAPLLFGGNHILVIFAQNICIRNCFFGLKMQNSPCPCRGTPPPRPSPRSVASLTRNSPRRLLSEGFGDMEFIFSPICPNFHLVLFNSWWIAWKLLWKIKVGESGALNYLSHRSSGPQYELICIQPIRDCAYSRVIQP